MGLDMYLTKRTYIGAHYEHRKVTLKIEGAIGEKTLEIDPKRVSHIEEQVGYWRKANQIHKWFVDNTQDGEDRNGESDVSRDQLKELLELCRKVKATAKVAPGMVKNGERMTATGWEPIMEEGHVIENPEEIAALLPTTSGFFFGSTEYDGYYMENIDNTITILGALDLEDDNYNVEYQYHASW